MIGRELVDLEREAEDGIVGSLEVLGALGEALEQAALVCARLGGLLRLGQGLEDLGRLGAARGMPQPRFRANLVARPPNSSENASAPAPPE